MAENLTLWESITSGLGIGGWLAGKISSGEATKPTVDSVMSGTGVAGGVAKLAREEILESKAGPILNSVSSGVGIAPGLIEMAKQDVAHTKADIKHDAHRASEHREQALPMKAKREKTLPMKADTKSR
jgi:hypothetical protein